MEMIQLLEKTSDVKLITASGEPLVILSHVDPKLLYKWVMLKLHHFVAVDCLIYPVILEIDFLHNNNMVAGSGEFLENFSVQFPKTFSMISPKISHKFWDFLKLSQFLKFLKTFSVISRFFSKFNSN